MHVEVFAANRVVIVPAGIGLGAPWRTTAGRVTDARCYGALVTLEPTGVVLVAPGASLRLGDLFRVWGQPLSAQRLASFRAPARRSVAVFVDGRRRVGPPGRVLLTAHAEIVLEIGPHVPPHSSYAFAPGPPQHASDAFPLAPSPHSSYAFAPAPPPPGRDEACRAAGRP